jgi:3-dehydroquinate dehydratase-2
MTARLMILNGPNLNFLGIREPHIYGSTTLAAIESSCQAFAGHIGVTLAFRQSNHEGELVELIQSARDSADAIIINPAAYSFTSIANHRRAEDIRRADYRAPYFEHPRPR